MTFGVFIHRSDSIYDDTPAEKYQFPKQYLDRARACLGDWIVYYEPRKVAETKGYYAVAKVERIIPDPSTPGMYLALIEPGSYLDFATSVPFADANGSSQRLSARFQLSRFRPLGLRTAFPKRAAGGDHAFPVSPSLPGSFVKTDLAGDRQHDRRGRLAINRSQTGRLPPPVRQ